MKKQYHLRKLVLKLYSSFINIFDMDFILVYQLDNTKITHLDLNEEFRGRKKK